MQGIGTRWYVAVVGLAICSLVLTACSSKIETPRPETLPYTLEQNRRFIAIDLDGDGRGERIAYKSRHQAGSEAPPERNALVIETSDKRTIEQVNYAAMIAEKLHFLDINGDGTRDFIAFKTTETGRPTPAHLQLIDPETGAVHWQATSRQPVKDVATVDLDHDRHIEVESEPGVGSVISLYLPADK